MPDQLSTPRHPSCAAPSTAQPSPLAIVLAGAWLSNLPLGVIAGYLLAALALLAAIANKVLGASCFAPRSRGALGLGLAAFYWLPAALERNWVDIQPGHRRSRLQLRKQLALRRTTPIPHSRCTTPSSPGLLDRRLHDRRRHRRAHHLLASRHAALANQAHSAGGFRSPPSPSSWRFFLSPSRAPCGIRCLRCPSCNTRGAGSKRSKRPWPSSSSPQSGLPPAVVRIAVAAVCALGFIAATRLRQPHYFQVCYPEDTVPVNARVATTRARALKACSSTSLPTPTSPLSPAACPTPASFPILTPYLGKPDPDDPDANPIWAPDQGILQATFLLPATPSARDRATPNTCASPATCPSIRLPGAAPARVSGVARPSSTASSNQRSRKLAPCPPRRPHRRARSSTAPSTSPSTGPPLPTSSSAAGQRHFNRARRAARVVRTPPAVAPRCCERWPTGLSPWRSSTTRPHCPRTAFV